MEPNVNLSPKDPGSDSQLANLAQTLNERFPPTRRNVLRGMLGVAATVFGNGLAALNLLSSETKLTSTKAETILSSDCFDVCDADQVSTSTTAAPTTTTSTLPPTTTSLPPPTTLPLVAEAVAETIPAPELESAPTARRGYDLLEIHGQQLIDNLPTLFELNQGFSSPLYADPERQITHIENLNQQVELSVEAYQAFNLDTSRAGVFAYPEIANKQIAVKAAVVHWTGAAYNDVDHFAASMHGRGLGTQNYVHSDASAYQLTPSQSHYQDHALGLAEFTAGIEVHSGNYDEANSPIFAFTPEITTSLLYTTLRILEENNLEASRLTVLGHYGADMLFINPYYNPLDGSLNPIEGHKPPSIRKSDPPQEFIDMIIPKLQKLQAELRAA